MDKYTIYKVTNKINGKTYIGSHKTKDLNDGYMGSGKYLKHAIEKHGVENFEKEILFTFDNAQEMYAKEAELVNEDYLTEGNTYNLKVGGFGGFDYINANLTKEFTKERAKKAYIATPAFAEAGIAYSLSIKLIKKVRCKKCQKEFEQNEKVQMFCSKSCSASFNNKIRKRTAV